MQIELKGVPIKNLKVLNNNAYLFDAREILASWGLKGYEKIKLVTNKEIRQGETVSFFIPDLQIILRRDEEDKILRVEQNYHSLTKFQPGLEASADDDLVGEEIQKFLSKYQSDSYQARINNCQSSQKYLVILDRIHHQLKTPNDLIEELIKQQKKLSRQLEIFIDQTEFKKKVTILKERYQNTDQIDQLRQELKKIDQEFLTIEKEINEHRFLVDEYLQQNWILVLQSDSRFKQLLINYNLSLSSILDNLTWWEVRDCLQEDGTLDYYVLEELIQEKKIHLSALNELGYKLTEIIPGEEYEE